MSARRAAMEAPTQQYRAEASRFAPDSPGGVTPIVSSHIRNLAVVDLRAVALNPESTRVVVDRVKCVEGWEGLRRTPSLDDLAVVLCDCQQAVTLQPPLSLRRLSVTDCSDACLRLLMRSVSAAEILLSSESRIDLRVLSKHAGLRVLRVHSALLTGISGLRAHPLHSLALATVRPDEALSDTLRALRETLEDLSLLSFESFGPDLLPALPALRRLTVPGFPEQRRAWIDYAVLHPEIGCLFVTPDAARPPRTSYSVEEIHRGVDIVRVGQGAKARFEVAADLAGLLAQADPTFKGDNGDVEDRLRAAATLARRKVTWSSESDALVARSPTLETCRWIIDVALGPPRA
jgi:hypothetical protein